jgi:hypothetical protein
MKKSTEKKLDRLAELLKDQEPGAADRCMRKCKSCECNGRHKNKPDADNEPVEGDPIQ